MREICILVKAHSTDAIDYGVLDLSVLRHLVESSDFQSQLIQILFWNVFYLLQVFYQLKFLFLTYQILQKPFCYLFYVSTSCSLWVFPLVFLGLQFIVKRIFLYLRVCSFQFLNLILIIILHRQHVSEHESGLIILLRGSLQQINELGFVLAWEHFLDVQILLNDMELVESSLFGLRDHLPSIV